MFEHAPRLVSMTNQAGRFVFTGDCGMTNKPILFNAAMVKAIMDGRKTQTRRVMNPQPVLDGAAWWYKDEPFIGEDALRSHLLHDVYGNDGSPYGSVYADGTADHLWVRETFQAQNLAGQWWHEVPRDERELHNWAWTNPVMPAYDAVPPRWLPSIHMPKIASRILLEVTAVRVERVQDISGDDVESICLDIERPDLILWKDDSDIDCNEWREFERTPPPTSGKYSVIFEDGDAPKAVYLHKSKPESDEVFYPYSWASNPFVWVVDFKMVDDWKVF